MPNLVKRLRDEAKKHPADGDNLYSLAADSIEFLEEESQRLAGDIDDLEDGLHGSFPRSSIYTRADLEAAIAGNDKDHLQIVLNDILGEK